MATVPPAAGAALPWDWATSCALLLVIAVGVALGWACRFSTLTIYGDDPIYLSLSHSLESGHYRDEFLVGSPPHAQYPPGMAIHLLLVRTLLGGGLSTAIGVNLLIIAATAAIAADSLRRLTTPWFGVAAAALVVLNPQITWLSRELRSEVPFLLCVALALWFSLWDGSRARRWYPVFAIAAALAAFLMRSAGIALVPAIGCVLVLRRQWRLMVLWGAVSTLVVVGWFSYTSWATQHGIGYSYTTDLSNLKGKGLGELVAHVLTRARAYFSTFAGTQFSIPDIPDQPIDNGVVGGLLLLGIAVGGWQLRRRWTSMVVFLALSGGLLLLFPWQVDRFLTALMPWLVVALLFGLRHILAGQRRGDAITLGVAVLLAGFGLAHQVAEAQHRSSCRAARPFSEPRCDTPEDRGYAAAAAFARDALPADAVIAASKMASMYAFSQRKSFPLALLQRPDGIGFLAPEGPVTTVLLSRQYRFEGADVAPWLLTRCSTLTLLFEHPTGALLLSVFPPIGEARNNACVALEEFIRKTPPDADG